MSPEPRRTQFWHPAVLFLLKFANLQFSPKKVNFSGTLKRKFCSWKYRPRHVEIVWRYTSQAAENFSIKPG